MYQFALFFQLLCVAVTFMLVIITVKKQATSAQKYLMIAAIAVLVHCVGYFLELAAPDTSAAVTALKVQFLGICFSTLFFMVFAFYYCRIKIPKWLYRFYLAGAFFVLFIVFTNEIHHLQYTTQVLITDTDFPWLYLEGGPLCNIHILLMVSQGIAILSLAFYRIIKGNAEERKRYVPVIVCAGVPIIVMILHHMDMFGPYNPTSLGQVIALGIAVGAIYRYNLFRVVQSAKEMLVDHMDDALVILDYEKGYMDANSKAKEIFPELDTITDGEYIERFNQYFNDFYKGELSGREYNMDDRYYRCSIHQIFEGKKHKGYTLQFADVTDVKKRTEELIEMTNKAEEANKAKSRFLANMSHEIRTPMNAIIGMSEIMLRGELNDSQRTNMESILFSSETLLGIINNILDLSKVEAGRLEPELKTYELETLLFDVCNICNMRLEERPIKFEVKTNPDIPTGFVGDVQLINEVLMNLLGNSIKYCRKGSITLSVDGHYMEDTGSEHVADWFALDFKVSDTGIGIKEEDLEKIFEAYTRTDSKKNRGAVGTGLGLAITKNYIELMKGTIKVESVYGEGTTFHVSIPQLVANTQKLGSSSIEIKDLQKKKEKEYKSYRNTIAFPGAKILVVDDIKVNLLVTTGLLEPYEVDIDVAESGQEAIEKIKNKDYDLVFMDHMMPDMDGLEATALIRQIDDVSKSQVTVVALTANALAGAKELFKDNGFNDYISKPMEVRRLEQILKKWLWKFKTDKDAEPIVTGTADNHEVGQEGEPENAIYEEFSQLEAAGIKPALGISYTGGKLEAYRFILNGFYDSFSEFEQDLNTIARQDLPGFRILIHGLKGALASIGAEELTNIAKSIEQAAANEDFTYIEEALPGFEASFVTIINSIGEYIKNE